MFMGEILRKLLFIKPKKPVTQDELDQLELVAKKAELEQRIAKAKAGKPGIIERVLGKSSYNPFDEKSPKRSDYDPFRW